MHHNEQKGELVVTGKNSIRIPLDGFPKSIKVYFKNVSEIVPCNPNDVDFVECDIHTSNSTRSGYILLIKWNVSGVREIVYEATF